MQNDIGNLIRLRHLFRSTAITRTRRVLSYHDLHIGFTLNCVVKNRKQAMEEKESQNSVKDIGKKRHRKEIDEG